MKKFFFIIIVLCLAIVNVNATKNTIIKYDHLNTKNIIERLDFNKLKSVKALCTYDYCDYVDTTSIEKGINNFVNRYLNTISDSEIKNTFKVKGIKITKVIFKD